MPSNELGRHCSSILDHTGYSIRGFEVVIETFIIDRGNRCHHCRIVRDCIGCSAEVGVEVQNRWVRHLISYRIVLICFIVQCYLR